MAMIARAMKLTGLSVSLTDSEAGRLLENCPDGVSASEYAKDSIAACLTAGIVSGRDAAGSIAPRDFITRAEAVVMLQKLLKQSGLI
jgi:hypothetical protein